MSKVVRSLSFKSLRKKDVPKLLEQLEQQQQAEANEDQEKLKNKIVRNEEEGKDITAAGVKKHHRTRSTTGGPPACKDLPTGVTAVKVPTLNLHPTTAQKRKEGMVYSKSARFLRR